MATELAFAKTFLSLLDSKPPKVSPDHVEDPRSYPPTTPYTLPRHPAQKPFSKPTSKTTTPSTATTGASPTTTTVTLVSPRNPPFTVALPSLPLTTSLAEIKERLAVETGLPLAKIKLLFRKKPVGDSKVLKDLLDGGEAGGEGGVELGVMVLGGGSVLPKVAAVVKGEETQVQQQEAEAVVEKKEGVLATGEFWEDLRGFLLQRVKDEGVAQEALGVFRAAWEARA